MFILSFVGILKECVRGIRHGREKGNMEYPRTQRFPGARVAWG
jgi:hypothetical protein